MSRQLALIAAVAGGLFVALSLPSSDISLLAWTGLVPLLLAVRGRSPREAFAIGWVGGFALYLVVMYWISPTVSNFTRITPAVAHGLLILFVGAFALFTGAFAAALEWLAAAGISRVVCAPLVWVVGEWLRTFFPIGCPWALLGYSQYRAGPVIQLADLGGIYLVSALIMFVNVVIAEVATDGVRRHRLLLSATAIVVAFALGYGSWRLAVIDAWPASGSIRVGLVQGNVAQDQKWDRALEEEILARHLALSQRAIDDGAELIVWPEAAVPFALRYDMRSARLVEMVRRSGASMLVGAPGLEVIDDPAGRRYTQYNRAWLVEPDAGLAAHYDKIQLVPFGEYVPFGFLLSWVDKAVQAIGDFGRGTEHVVFEVPARAGRGRQGEPVGVGCLICYEGIFPALTRRFVASGADLLVNISNDAWYGRTSAPYQHLAMASVRAIENRVPLVRATNTGVTAIVDPAGRIRGATPLFEEAVLVDDVELIEAGSVYRTLGDWFVYLCIAAVLALAALRVRLGAVLIRES